MALIILLLGFIAILVFAYHLDVSYLKGIGMTREIRDPLFPPYAPEPSHFTQAEAQQLSSLLKVQLSNAEGERLHHLKRARKFKAEGDKEAATAYYGGAENCTQFIKKFGKLQSKLKHSIQTRG